MTEAETRAVLRELGHRVQRARRKRGLTQENAATSAGIDYKRWQRIEQGAANVTVHTVVRVAAALGLTFWELVGRE